WDGDTADGSSSSRWASNADPDTLATAPRWVELDLGSSKSITEFVVHPYQSRAYHYQIHVSSDGSTWGSAAVDVSQSSGASSYTHTLGSAVRGRYVRLTVDGIAGTSTPWASINELDIFGTSVGSGGGSGPVQMASDEVVMEAE